MQETKEKKTKQRKNGEGSIFQRDGRFIGQISVGCDANGKRIRRYVYGDTLKEVRDEMTRLKNQQISGKLSAVSKLTVAQYLSSWLENVVKLKTRASTHASYQQIVEKHINPTIGGLKIATLTAMQIQGLYGEMARSGKSPRLRQMAHVVLRRALSVAVKSRIIPFNVCADVERPTAEKPEMKYLNAKEAAAFLKSAETDRLYALYVLAIYGGRRQGELFGLKREDLELSSRKVVVQRTLIELNGKFSEGPPKSKKGKCSVTLPPIAVDTLRDHLKRMLAEGYAGSQYVFCDSDGGPLRRQNILRRSFRPILERAGVKQVRFHDLRHTSATLMMLAGVNPKVVQERLGHSQIGITLDTYSYVVEGMDAEAAEKIGAVLGSVATA
jgi:integrase